MIVTVVVIVLLLQEEWEWDWRGCFYRQRTVLGSPGNSVEPSFRLQGLPKSYSSMGQRGIAT